jgi:hypothetical protein
MENKPKPEPGRRLGPSILMTRDNYVRQLEELLRCYPEVDHMGCKDYFGEVTLVPVVTGATNLQPTTLVAADCER